MTNHDLALVSAENERLARQAMAMIQAADLSIAGGIKIIADTYAEPMAELEQTTAALRDVREAHERCQAKIVEQQAELERLKRQVAFVTELAMYALGDVGSIDLYYDRGSYRTWLEFEDDGVHSNFKIKDCPHNEVAT